MKILIAPDKFKESISALEVAQSVSKGIHSVMPAAEIVMQPIADGGDGSLAILSECIPMKEVPVNVVGPDGRIISAVYYRETDTAYAELALASGLVLLNDLSTPVSDRTTFGTGQLIAHAIYNGCKEVVLFLGGSSTTDGGIGIAAALGFQFLDKNKKALEPIGRNLGKIVEIKRPPDWDRIANIKFNILCDVKNPFFGVDGAAFTYGPQKGAQQEEVEALDKGMQNLYRHIIKNFGMDVQRIEGSGAAGGIGGGMVGFFNGSIQSGAEYMFERLEMGEKIKAADVIITGEGKIDETSLKGKVISAFLSNPQVKEKPFILICGLNDLESSDLTAYGVQQIYSVAGLAIDQEDSMRNAANYLNKIGKKIGRWLEK